MKSWLTALADALLLRTSAYERIRDRRDAFFLGFVLLVAVALLAGLPELLSGTFESIRPAPPGVESNQVLDRVEQALLRAAPFLDGLPEDVREQVFDGVRQGVETGIEIATQVSALETLLPKPVGRLFETVGLWLSQPFSSTGFPLTAASLTTWLGYGIWVMLFAKLFGGRGTLVGFFGASALYGLPHVMGIVSFIPRVGGLLAIIAFIWGLAIYVKATAVSHWISPPRAVAAVFLPALLLLAALLLAGALATVVLALSASATP